MQCPVCTVDLMMSERLGVEIDYCPKCRGVWLDRGELDKIIEKSAVSSHVQPEHQAPAPAPRHQDAPAHAPRYDDHGQHHKPHKKKENFLMDLFDF